MSVWWPGVSKQMEEFVKKCPTCMRLSPPVREPMTPSPLPTYPWEKVATDLFEFQGQHYLLLTVPRSHQIIINHLSICHLRNEVSLHQTWYPEYYSERQWSSVRLCRDEDICVIVRIQAHHKQSPLSTE